MFTRDSYNMGIQVLAKKIYIYFKKEKKASTGMQVADSLGLKTKDGGRGKEAD